MPTFEVRLRAAVLVLTTVAAWTALIGEARRDATVARLGAPAPAASIATWCSLSPQVD